jgi:RHS repeat-associated protein
VKALGWAALAVAMATAPLQATYSYYYTDPFASISTTAWHQNGVASVAAGVGLTSTDPNGGSLISLVAPPAGQVNGEIDSTLALTTTGGTIVHYHLASSDARSGPAASGSYLSAELRSVSITGGVCSATLVVEQRVSNVVTDLVNTQVGCKSNSLFRTVMQAGSNTLYVFIDNFLAATATAPTLSGSPGIGVRNCGAGTGIAQTQLGTLDTIAPGAIPAGTLRWTPSSTQIEFQWGGAEDDASGVGIGGYVIYRKVNPSDPSSQWVYFALTPVPDWVDQTVQANSTYAYNIYPYDADYNLGPASAVVITTPAAPTTVARRIGVRPTGAYWGAGGEQIDLFSGNLNVTVPLLKPLGRNGMSAPINLSYNSQLWREDANGTWNLGGDVGFGYGWRLLIGSITPVYNGVWTLDHYVYTDSTGAQYRLDTKENGLWRSSEGVYVRYDDTKNWLIFPDGHFLEMDVVSQGGEWDAGTRYPSRMIDTNANYLQFVYMQGQNAPTANSSARLQYVYDPRVDPNAHGCTSCPISYRVSYILTYDNSAVPHLTSVSNNVLTAESYSLSYTNVANLVSPFSPTTSFGPTSFLTSLTSTVLGTSNTFSYDAANSGELVQMNLPDGGVMQWSYSPWTNSAGMTQREVSSRSLTTLLNGTPNTVAFAPDAGDSSLILHAQRQLTDAPSGALRAYFFQSDASSPYAGMLTSERDFNADQSIDYRTSSYTWAQDPWGHPYVAETDVTQDPGTTAAVTAKTTQTMAADKTGAYGQIASTSQYNYTDLVNAARTHAYSYTAITTGLVPNFWRPSATSLIAGSSSWNLQTINYDYPYMTISGGTDAVLQDSGLLAKLPQTGGARSRGRPTTSSSAVGDTRTQYYGSYLVTGNLTGVSVNNPDSSVVSTPDSPGYGRYMTSAAVTPNSNSNLASSFTWTTFLGLSQETDPNGSVVTVGYDSAARPKTTTSPDGATTTYTYTNATSSAPATVTAAINGRWTITTLDGLGRTIQTDAGTGTPSTSSSVSRVLTVYGPCACTPVGKVVQVSRPFNPSNSETPVYTTYTYDPLGRTTQVTLPDGASHTTYAYSGNTATVTDPGGRWKKYSMDVFGNVTQVNEPNPAGGADYVTQYTYNAFDKLTNVTMPRTMPSGTVVTQTRTFTYDSTQHLVSTTQPESGTTTYTYDYAGRVLTKTATNNNKVTYTYDQYGRVTLIQRTPGYGSVEPEPTTTFTYDNVAAPTGMPSNLQWSFPPVNTWGRVAMITHGSLSVERFQYTPSGRISAKSLSTLGTYPTAGTEQLPFIGTFTWDSEGRLTGYSGHADVDPVGVDALKSMDGGYGAWTYDGLGRPLSLTYSHATGSSVPLVQNATYNAAGQLTSYQFPYDFEDTGSGNITYTLAPLQFTYNSLGQMTEQFSSNPAYSAVAPDIKYQYSATANDGRIQSQVYTYARFFGPGPSMATSAYSYDSLGRLTAVAGNQAFVYDPFGNLLQENVTGGSAPALSITVDPTTNRVNAYGFAYDAAGNLTQTPDGKTYAYNSENRMSQGNEGTYYYDSNGERLASGSPIYTSTWYFHGPGGIEVSLISATSSISCGQYSNGFHSGFCVKGSAQEKLYFAGRLVFQGDSFGTGGVATVTDRLGSVVQVDNSGITDYVYYPYGGAPSGFIPPQVTFATYEAAGTSMLYAQNRYYDSARGRFTTPDPSSSSYDLRNPLSFNRYAYVMGDPINKNDPSGLCGNDSSDDGSGDADGDGSNGDDDSGGGDISGGGGGGGEDEISDGHEMNADAFGRHRASRRRVKILGDTSDNPCAICQTGYSVLNGQCVRTGTFIPPGTPLMSSTQSPWSAYYSCVGLGWAAYFSSGTFLYTNLGAPFAPGKPPGYGLVLAGISDLGAAYSIRQNCTQQAFGSGFSPGITSGGNP